MSAELHTIIDFIRYGASRFGAAGLSFGHSFDNALDEATQLVLHVLHLPHDTGPAYGQARLVAEEKAQVLALFQRLIDERIPACYLTGEAWFAGLSFKCDSRALVPRSPIAELIESGFEPWLGACAGKYRTTRHLERAAGQVRLVREPEWRGLRPDRDQSALRDACRDRCAAEGIFARARDGPARRRRRPGPGARDPA